MVSNPIHQRIEEFELKYLELRYTHDYRYLILRTAQEDWEMLDAFCDFMLGIDNEINDVVLVFQSPLYQSKTYSKTLVEELFSWVFLWNFSGKPNDVESNYLDWEMDMSCESDKNVAALFVANMNAFCTAVELEEDSNIVCVLQYQNDDAKRILHWLKDLAQLELHPRVNIIVCDTFENPAFDALKDYAPKSTQLLSHRFDLNQAIKEIGAMGDPEAPETKFRLHLVQMYDALYKHNFKSLKKHADICLAIADENIEKDSNWSMQKMMIYSMLSSFTYGEKQYKEAINYIDQGIESIQDIKEGLSDVVIKSLLVQGLLFRGNIYLLLKQYEVAKADFVKGEMYCENGQDYLMQIEALRLIAEVARKMGNQNLKHEALNKGVRLGSNMDATLAQSSTYSLLVMDVLKSRYNSYISDQELDAIVTPLLGRQWRVKGKNVKSIIVNNNLK